MSERVAAGGAGHVLRRARRWLEVGLWADDLRSLPRWRALRLGSLRVATHVLGSFGKNLGGIRAAGLSMITLLSIVPILVLVFGVASGLGYREKLDELIVEWTAGFPANTREAIETVRGLVKSTRLGALGIIGSLLLAYSALTLFTRVEQALNYVWRARKSRSWARRIVDFVAFLVLVPLFGLASILLNSIFASAGALRETWPLISLLVDAGAGAIPPLLMGLAFTLLYKIVPNVRVRWIPAMLGGLVAGATWIIVYGVYLRFQVGVGRLNAIYATLAALPLLLVYLQLSWTILLVGADVSFAVQNIHRLRVLEHLPPPSFRDRRRIAMHVVGEATRRFTEGRKGVDVVDLASRCDLPGEWVVPVVDDLVAAGLLLRVDGEEDFVVPARPPALLTLAEVARAVEGPENDLVRRLAVADPCARALEAVDQSRDRELGPRSFDPSAG